MRASSPSRPSVGQFAGFCSLIDADSADWSGASAAILSLVRVAPMPSFSACERLLERPACCPKPTDQARRSGYVPPHSSDGAKFGRQGFRRRLSAAFAVGDGADGRVERETAEDAAQIGAPL